MTINLKAKQDKTLCGGTIQSLVDQGKMQTNLKFSNVKEVQQCAECAFKNMCPIEKEQIHGATINVKAFTGMPIAALPIIRETKSFIEVETKQGSVIRFDRKSGVQTNCANSRYASRVDPDDIPFYNNTAPAPTK